MWQNRVRNTSLLDSRRDNMPYEIGRARCQEEGRSHSYVRNHICAIRQTTFPVNELCKRIRRKIEGEEYRSPVFVGHAPVNFGFVHLLRLQFSLGNLIWCQKERKMSPAAKTSEVLRA